MGLFDNLLGGLLKLTDPTPRYTGARCLLEKNAVGGCDRCEQACPHQAINLSSYSVTVEDTRCTGCGLCTAVCPGIALEFPLGPVQEALHRGKGQLRCSKTQGSGEEVLCLGRLTPGVLAEAGSRLGTLTLAHADCQTCRLGGATVPQQLETTISEARRFFPALEVRLQQSPLPGTPVDRRQLFRAMMGGAQRSAAELLPQLPMLEQGSTPEQATPAELRLRQLATRKAESARWPRIAVGEGCTLCPVCTNVCPTQAVSRTRQADEYLLTLDPAACTGCGACVESCPPQVIRLTEANRETVLGGSLELHRGTPPWYDL
jgi:Fe-S-cluster-containing hydrogenase component 2